MTFKPKIWFPIATVLSALNLVAVWFAAAPGEPAHATLHAGLAMAFGYWAVRLRQRQALGEREARVEALEGEASRLESIDDEMDRLRQALSETQERLDFAERMLVQGREQRRDDLKP
jgi:hypothetical protein